MAGQVRFVSRPLAEGQAVAELAAYDADGNPVELGAGPSAPAEGSVTTAQLAAGAVTPAKLSGYDPATGHGMVPRVKADGSGFDLVALPAVPAAPTADTLTGATATGRALLKATDAATARTAIGAGIPYTLPAATTAALGGVKKGATVGAVTATDPAAAAGETPTKAEFDTLAAYAKALKATVNQLVASLKTAGIIG